MPPHPPDPASTLRARGRGWAVALLLVTLLLVTLGCRSSPVGPAPAAPDLFAGPPDVPVVLVPGITGVALRDRESGELAWGDGKRLVVPRDHGWSFALPLVEGETSPLVPGRVIREIRLGPVRKPVYQPVIDALVRAGFRLGDLEAPGPHDTLLLFAYDWRRSNVESATALAAALERLRLARGGGALAVDLICQSNGSSVCRWLAKYGDAALEEVLPETSAELPADTSPGSTSGAASGGPSEARPELSSGSQASSGPIRVRRIVLAGTANGGSTRMFRELVRGRRYLPFGRWIRPETLFTLPSFFQDLPVAERPRFVDRRGRELGLSLDAPEDWTEQGWSIFSPEARQRIARSERAQRLFGTEADWTRHLVEQLDRARLLHRLLRADAPSFATERICSIQSRTRNTPSGALVLGPPGRQELRFTGDRALRRHPAAAAAITAPGDLHATVTSQGWLSPQEVAVLGETTWVDGDHFELILDPVSLTAIVECLRGSRGDPTRGGRHRM